MPWNQKTSLGYFVEICASFTVVESYMVVNGTFLVLFLSMCEQHQGFYRVAQHLLKGLDQVHNRKTVEMLLKKLIRIHVMAEQ